MLLGVPRDAQITKIVLQDVRMCPQKPKKLLKLAPNQASKPVNQQISRWGPAAGAKPVEIRRARPWPAVGVVGRSPRKVPTFPEGNPGVFAPAAEAGGSIQKSCFFCHAQKI